MKSKNAKIIETHTDYPDVLVARFLDEEGIDCVEITAFGDQGGNEYYFAREVIEFDSPDAAINFISDYSIESANAFCKRNQIAYI